MRNIVAFFKAVLVNLTVWDPFIIHKRHQSFFSVVVNVHPVRAFDIDLFQILGRFIAYIEEYVAYSLNVHPEIIFGVLTRSAITDRDPLVGIRIVVTVDVGCGKRAGRADEIGKRLLL